MSRLLLLGTGLIGCSFALAARKAGLVEHVSGLDSHQDALQQALSLKIIDTAIVSGADTVDALKTALAQCSMVVVAVPVQAIPAAVANLYALGVPEHCVVFDVGSVKQKVIQGIRAQLDYLPDSFVPLHPIAGSEQHGPEAAHAELFSGRKVIITPETETASWAIERVRNVWVACGAVVSALESAVHDEILSATSHLPHFMAFGLMTWLDARDSDEALEYAGGGLKDFSRIAESDAQMWTSIFEDNAQYLVPQIDELLKVLQKMRDLVEGKRSSDLKAQLESARQTRLRLLSRMRS